MAKTFTITSKNRMVPGPSGMGAKVVSGNLSMGPASEAVHHSDVELNTINVLLVDQHTLGSYTAVRLFSPGTYDNYASLISYNLGTGGPPIERSAGTLNARFLAMGE